MKNMALMVIQGFQMTKKQPNWFIDQLFSLSDRKAKIDRTGVWIRCPYHSNGMENTPSLHVNLSKPGITVGKFHCLACSEKGNWNKLAEKLSLKHLKASDDTYTAPSFTFSIEKENDLLPLNKLINWPMSFWRGIPKTTLDQYSVKAIFKQKELIAYIPVIEYNTLKGAIYAKSEITTEQRKQGIKPYLFSQGSWKSSCLYGFDNALKHKSNILWVVEGVRDAMKLASFGAKVVAVLGSNFSKEQKFKVDIIDPEVIVIASDPDEAGDKLAVMIENYYQNTIKVDFKPGTDAADLDVNKYNNIVKRLNKVLYKEVA